MSRGAARAPALLLALVLGGLAATFAWRATTEEPPSTVVGALPLEHVAEAKGLLARLLQGLASLQEPDGAFALEAKRDPASEPVPQVKRCAAAALAAWAYVEAAAVGVAPPEAVQARERALAYLMKQRQPDGWMGRMPPSPLGVVDRGPEVTALSASLLAFLPSQDQEQALLVPKATSALAPLLSKGGVRDGWQRALSAMAVDALVRAGRGATLGREPRKLMPLGETRTNPDCGDYRLAEAIVRTLRGEPASAGDLYPERVLGACLTTEPLRWGGQTTDLQSWLMQAWLATRSPQGAAWFRSVLGPLADGVGPAGVVPGGIYADQVTQSACGALLLCLGLRPQT